MTSVTIKSRASQLGPLDGRERGRLCLPLTAPTSLSEADDIYVCGTDRPCRSGGCAHLVFEVCVDVAAPAPSCGLFAALPVVPRFKTLMLVVPQILGLAGARIPFFGALDFQAQLLI